MAAVQNGRQPSGVRLESSLESQESRWVRFSGFSFPIFKVLNPKCHYFSLNTTATSQDQASDDEDDELLALRIAALESIKIKEAKVAWSYPPLYNMCSISGKGRC